MNELVVRDLRMSYDGSEFAVKGISFTAPEGKITTLLGPSGCGKTTTLRCVAGLEDPNGGEIVIGGHAVVGPSTYVPAQRRNVNMVFQSYATWPHLTVFENVAYGLRVQRIPDKALKERVGAALDIVGLGAFAQRHPGQLSGGQQQRVAVARAVVTDPGLILFDEPLSNLDAALRVKMRKELVELQRELGKTSLYVTHDQAEAMAMSDQMILLADGELVQAGAPEEIYERPINRLIAEFMGAANTIAGKLSQVNGNLGTLVTESGVHLTGLLRDQDVAALANVVAVIRPAALRIVGSADGTANSWSGPVLAREYVGGDYIFDVETLAGILTVEGADSRPEVGDTVTVSVPAEDVLIVRP